MVECHKNDKAFWNDEKEDSMKIYLSLWCGHGQSQLNKKLYLIVGLMWISMYVVWMIS